MREIRFQSSLPFLLQRHRSYICLNLLLHSLPLYRLMPLDGERMEGSCLGEKAEHLTSKAISAG
jgi:hypothetical protein